MSLPPLSSSDHARGDLNAPVVVVHYGDFQCPYSGALHPVLLNAKSKMGDSLCVVFRHFPLDDVHPDALVASIAAEAAASFGEDKFWAVHDLLFENQNAIVEDYLFDHVESLGLDEDALVEKMEADATSDIVTSQREAARAAGAHGTPTLFINGQFHDNKEGLWKASKLLPLLEQALQNKSA